MFIIFFILHCFIYTTRVTFRVQTRRGYQKVRNSTCFCFCKLIQAFIYTTYSSSLSTPINTRPPNYRRLLYLGRYVVVFHIYYRMPICFSFCKPKLNVPRFVFFFFCQICPKIKTFQQYHLPILMYMRHT